MKIICKTFEQCWRFNYFIGETIFYRNSFSFNHILHNVNLHITIQLYISLGRLYVLYFRIFDIILFPRCYMFPCRFACFFILDSVSTPTIERKRDEERDLRCASETLDSEPDSTRRTFDIEVKRFSLRVGGGEKKRTVCFS